jgi:hypothetical protein
VRAFPDVPFSPRAANLLSFDLTLFFFLFIFTETLQQAHTSWTEDSGGNDRVRDEYQESDEDLDLLVLVQSWLASSFLSPWCETHD